MKFEEVKKYTLYSSLTKELCNEYSLFKLGHVGTITKLSKKIATVIKKHSKKKNLAIYATGKYPTNQFCKKNSLLLAENVSKTLKVPLIIGEYKYTYNKNSFCDGQKTNRKIFIHPPFIKSKKQLQKHGYNVFMIDDSIVSGTSLKVSLKELSQITDNLSFISIVKIDPKKHLESDINDYVFENTSYQILSQISMKKGYVFTSHMLRTIDSLSTIQQKEFLSKIGAQQKKLFKKAYQVYFGKLFAL